MYRIVAIAAFLLLSMPAGPALSDGNAFQILSAKPTAAIPKVDRRGQQVAAEESEEGEDGGGPSPGAAVQACPQNMRGRALAPGQRLRCACGPGQMRGSVWGTNRYTADSSICRAALHAGATSPNGGTVTVYAGGSCPGFVGTTRNGVRTGNWGRYGQTYAFRYPLPRCTTAQAPAGPV